MFFIIILLKAIIYISEQIYLELKQNQNNKSLLYYKIITDYFFLRYILNNNSLLFIFFVFLFSLSKKIKTKSYHPFQYNKKTHSNCVLFHWFIHSFKTNYLKQTIFKTLIHGYSTGKLNFSFIDFLFNNLRLKKLLRLKINYIFIKH